MRWWDLDEVLELETVLFDEPWTREQFLGELAHVPQSRHYLVVRDGEGLRGYAGLRAVPPEADVQTLAVAPRTQGTGLGRALLDELLAEARRRGCTEVFLEVRHDNEPARALYIARGFEQIAQRPDYYGTDRHAAVMRLRMSDEVAP